jgi:hypothetical protein
LSRTTLDLGTITLRLVKLFLVTYDRHRSRLLDRVREFDDRSEAYRALHDAEEAHRGDENVEVVLLGGESEADLHRTHSRYWKSVSELAS